MDDSENEGSTAGIIPHTWAQTVTLPIKITYKSRQFCSKPKRLLLGLRLPDEKDV